MIDLQVSCDFTRVLAASALPRYVIISLKYPIDVHTDYSAEISKLKSTINEKNALIESLQGKLNKAQSSSIPSVVTMDTGTFLMYVFLWFIARFTSISYL